MSLTALVSVITNEAALVVGILRLCINSEQRYSLNDDRITALPSANREYGVKPAPFSYNSWPFKSPK